MCGPQVRPLGVCAFPPLLHSQQQTQVVRTGGPELSSRHQSRLSSDGGGRSRVRLGGGLTKVQRAAAQPPGGQLLQPEACVSHRVLGLLFLNKKQGNHSRSCHSKEREGDSSSFSAVLRGH